MHNYNDIGKYGAYAYLRDIFKPKTCKGIEGTERNDLVQFSIS